LTETKRSSLGWYWLKIAVLVFVVYYALRLILFYVLYRVLPPTVYGILNLALFVAVFAALPALAYRRIMRVPDVTSTRSISVPVSKETVCELVPQLILKSKWKLIDSDKTLGHFKARIGASIWTWGETMLVDVSMNEDGSTKVDVYCEVIHHQKADHGKLDKDVDKFYRELENLINQQSKS
jgi:hypothetical protein